jgi:hypothetical protein
MQLELIWHEEVTPIALTEGVVKVGGGSTDAIQLAGLPPGLLSLALEGDTLTVSAIRSVRIAGALFPAHVPRLLVEGEELRLPNELTLRRPVDAQRRASRKTMGTAFVAKELLTVDFTPTPQATRAASLTCVAGADQGRVFTLAFDDATVGRADDAHVRVRDRSVSRQHARLVKYGRTHALVPLGATNGVFINGVRLSARRVLAEGDIMELGQTMLRYEPGERAPEEQTQLEPRPAPALPVPTPPALAEEVSASALTTPLDDPRRARAMTRQELGLMAVGAALVLTGLGISLAALWLR